MFNEPELTNTNYTQLTDPKYKAYLVWYACKYGDGQILKKLVDRGLDLSLRVSIHNILIISPKNEITNNAIGAAIAGGNIDSLRFLVKKVPEQILELRDPNHEHKRLDLSAVHQACQLERFNNSAK